MEDLKIGIVGINGLSFRGYL